MFFKVLERQKMYNKINICRNSTNVITVIKAYSLSITSMENNK